MPTLNKQYTLTITVEQFLSSCSYTELQELDLLLGGELRRRQAKAEDGRRKKNLLTSEELEAVRILWEGEYCVHATQDEYAEMIAAAGPDNISEEYDSEKYFSDSSLPIPGIVFHNGKLVPTMNIVLGKCFSAQVFLHKIKKTFQR